MKKKLIRLTESDLHRIVENSVKRVIREGFFNKDKDDYDGRYDDSYFDLDDDDLNPNENGDYPYDWRKYAGHASRIASKNPKKFNLDKYVDYGPYMDAAKNAYLKQNGWSDDEDARGMIYPDRRNTNDRQGGSPGFTLLGNEMNSVYNNEKPNGIHYNNPKQTDYTKLSKDNISRMNRKTRIANKMHQDMRDFYGGKDYLDKGKWNKKDY